MRRKSASKRQKHTASQGLRCVFVSSKLLLGADSTVGAAVCASTAVQAGAGVDHILIVTLRDRAGGANISAGAAADASRRNLVGHGSTSIQFVIPILPHNSENASAPTKICGEFYEGGKRMQCKPPAAPVHSKQYFTHPPHTL